MNKLWEKYAEVLVDYSTKVKKGDLVIIRATSPEAQPLVKEIYKQVLLKGANPVVKTSLEGLGETFIKYASDEQLAYIDPMTEVEYDRADVMISIGAPVNTKSMAKADSKKMAQRSAATREFGKSLLASEQASSKEKSRGNG